MSTKPSTLSTVPSTTMTLAESFRELPLSIQLTFLALFTGLGLAAASEVFASTNADVEAVLASQE